MSEADTSMPSPAVESDDNAAILTMRRVGGLMILLLALFGVAYSWVSWRTEKNRELHHLSSLVELGEKSLDSYFMSLESILNVLSQDMRRDGQIDIERAEILLKRLKEANPDLRIAIVAGLDGQVLATTQTSRGQALPSLANEPSFQLARDELSKGQTLSIGRPFLGPVSKEWIIPLRYGAREKNGKLLFLVGAGLALSKPQSFWKDAPLPQGAVLALRRDDGYLVLRYPVPEKMQLAEVFGQPRDGALGAFLQREHFPVSGALEAPSDVSGLDMLCVFRRLSHYPVTFYVAEPRSYLWAMWWQKVQFSYVLMLLLLFSGFAIYRWARRRQVLWEIERQQRMTALQSVNRDLEAFTYSISHDLRAPIRHIDAYARMLNEEMPDLKEPALGHLHTISKSASRMGTMVDELLRFSRTGRAPLRTRRVDLNRLVAEVRDECMRDAHGRNIAWKIVELPVVMGDPALLRLVFDNLLSNAIKFTALRSEATIEISARPGDEDEVVIDVRDNGTGFDMRYASKLFGVFQRLHREADFEGTGIGLATVQRIVQRHGGRVWAEAEPGRGAIFHVALKRASDN